MEIKGNFPYRPGYGTKGQNVVLWTNYFELVTPSSLVLHRYDVKVMPAADQPNPTGKKLRQIFKLLLELPHFDGFRDDIVTDFKSVLISRIKLDIEVVDIPIQYRAEGEDIARANAPSYTIHIQRTKTLDVSGLIGYLTSKDANATYEYKQEVLQALNIFLGHYAKSSSAFATVGSRKIYSLSPGANGWDLGVGLRALRGFFSSVRVATRRILVNVNISHGVFYDAIPLNKLIQTYELAHQSDSNRGKLQSFLKRVRVRVTHLAEKKNGAGVVIPRVKTIFGLASTDDGHGSDNPPRVQKFGAGPKEVEFFRKDPTGGPSGSSTSVTTDGQKTGKAENTGLSSNGPDRDAPHGRYISVYNYFTHSMCSINAKLYSLLIV